MSKSSRLRNRLGSTTADGHVITGARTKQRSVPFLFMESANQTSCKHFCCRDGLEKPPKASRKRDTGGNQKSNSLNQLTLSASITKRDAEGVGSALTQPVFKRNLGSRQRQAWGSAISGTQKTPSDYGDDGLDEFPSPSALLAELEASPIQSAPEDRKIREDTEDILDELLLADHTPSAESAKESARKANKQMDPNQPESPGCIPPNSTIDNRQLPELDTEPIPVSSTDITSSNGLKRKFYPPSKTNDHDDKRVKGYAPHTPRPGEKQETVLPELTPSKQNTAVGREQSMQKGWEDIDPSLLDEFKDLVNFF